MTNWSESAGSAAAPDTPAYRAATADASTSKALRPGDVLGIVGGGQLGQMMAESAARLGLRTVVLDPTPGCPAAQVCDQQIVADYSDRAAIAELARLADTITYEFENVDADALADLDASGKVPQGTEVLRISQDRGAEKRFVSGLGVPLADYQLVEDPAQLPGAVAQIGYPSVLKTTRGGYDGKGQLVLRGPADLAAAGKLVAARPCVLEAWVPYVMEISVLVATDGRGGAVVFPVCENTHRDNILHLTVVPARVSDAVAQAARTAALQIADALGVAGLLAVEMFVTADGEVLVNEIAPRPHNSGHATIEACSASQFDAHVRAVAGWELPQPELVSAAVMVNVLGQHLAGARAAAATHPDWVFHDYGKAEPRPGRKVAHITVPTDDVAAAIAEIESSGVWA